MALKSYEAFFWPFYARALWPQKWSFWQKNNFTKFAFTLFKKSQNFRSLANKQLKWGLKNSRGGGSGRCIFHSINLKFYEKSRFFLFMTRFSFTCLPPLGGKENAQNWFNFNVGKKYVAQIYKKKAAYQKSHSLDKKWSSQRSLKLAVQPDTRILVTCIPDPVDILEFFQLFKKCLHNILVI